MREIKFRAWDNVRNKMYYTGESDEVEFSFDSNGIVATDLTGHDWGFKKLEHLQYMQFTGLKDKNGKEIYEGDLIKKKFKDREIGEFYAIGEVVYGYWYAGFTVPYNYHGYNKLERLSNSFDKDGWVVANRDMEIIGNIYENPELIKG